MTLCRILPESHRKAGVLRWRSDGGCGQTSWMHSRRDVLAGLGLVAVGSAALPRMAEATVSMNRVLPMALGDGDKVAVIACSSGAENANDFDVARDLIKALRLKVVFGLYATKTNGFLAGTDEERLHDLHAAFADPTVKGIILLRGGYGAQRILDRIDYGLVRRNPKVVVGYSDVTALLVAFWQKAGLVCFHGPVASSSPSPFSEAWMRHAVGSDLPLGDFGTPPGADFKRVCIVPGVASGRLVGGNLTMLSTSLGTPYEIDTRGAILFFEDIGEASYRVDRMITQLRLAGKLSTCSGIAVGQFTNDTEREPAGAVTWQQVVDSHLQSLGKPAMRGMAIGHVREKVTVPVGCLATLDSGALTLSVTEGAVLPKPEN